MGANRFLLWNVGSNRFCLALAMVFVLMFGLKVHAQDEIHSDIDLRQRVVAGMVETLKAMEKHFVMSCKLEHMFWDQAQFLTEWPELKE